jgi:X-X-X-Leu-X-X-Gly heptad repeat protein
MIRLARLSIRRPIASLAVCGVIVLGLALVGLGVSSSLSPTITTVPGTQSSHAQHLAEAEFGPSVLVPVLLEGPARDLDRQGPALVRALSRRPDTRTLSAWDAGDTGAALRPERTAAMIVAAVAKTEKQMVKTEQKEIDEIVGTTISSPVSASITGQPTIDIAMKDQSIADARRGVVLALPILFVVLLLLLRAPVAALGLTALGAATAFSGLGITALLGKVQDVDAIDVVIGAMSGLSLGVAYGLIIFRRWRTELREDVSHHDAAHAAATTVETSGRAILIGGTALIASLVVADMLAPSEVLSSLAITALLCAILAVGAAVVVVPAALVLLGDRALAFSFGAPAPLAHAWDRLTAGRSWVVRDAVPVGAVATALLALLAIPLLSLDSGPPSPKFLPEDDPARLSFERVAQVMGPGWPTPYNIVFASETRPVTEKELLAEVSRYQAKLAKDPRVDSVVGPGAFAATSRDLGVLPRKLRESTKLLKGGKKDLGRLEAGLGQAGAGAAKLQSGLTSAAGGAGTLQSGSGKLQAGSGTLRSGLADAREGSAQISAGLGTALDAARKLRDGATKALAGSERISGGLGQAVKPVKSGVPVVRDMAANVTASKSAVTGAAGSVQSLSAQLDAAAADLRRLPASAQTQEALAAVSGAQQVVSGLQSSLGTAASKLNAAEFVAKGFADQVSELSTGLAQLYAGSTDLTGGIAQLQDGNSRLAAGIEKLSGGGGQLTAGLTRLRDGAGQLEAGLGQLTSGSGQLAGGLSAGTGPTGQLVSGLGRLESGVAVFRKNLPSPKDLERLQEESPGLFESGYFVLAAIQGASAAQREQASFAVNLERGGNAGQIVVVSRFAAEDPRSQELGEDLTASVDRFAAESDTDAALGGPAGSLADYRSETASRIWPVVIGVSVVVLILMMLLLRAVILPLVAVAFDLLTAAATLGIVALLFGGDDPPLGGPGYIDPMTIIAAFAAVFGISMLFQVQLLARTREAFLQTGDAHEALRTGLDRTAAAVTGAALVAVAAIVPFAISEIVVVRELGVAIAVAVLLDAFVVRPVLLPAAVEVLGRASWWPTTRQAPGGRERRERPAPPPPTPLSPAPPVAGGGS